MNKPTIPCEVADVIEDLRVDTYSNEEIVSFALNNDGSVVHSKLNLISFDTLMSALVNGYERELTEEQKHAKIAQVYAEHKRGAGFYGTADEDDIYADGIKFTLDTIGIQIEGVNA